MTRRGVSRYQNKQHTKRSPPKRKVLRSRTVRTIPDETTSDPTSQVISTSPTSRRSSSLPKTSLLPKPPTSYMSPTLQEYRSFPNISYHFTISTEHISPMMHESPIRQTPLIPHKSPTHTKSPKESKIFHSCCLRKSKN